MTHDQFNRGVLLQRMLELWVEISGVSPDAESVSIKMSGKLSSYDVKKMHDELREMFAEDDGLTATLMLGGFFRDFCKETTIPLWDIIRSSEEKEGLLKKARELDELLRSEPIAAMEQGFMERMRQAASHYGFAIEQDPSDLAFVRRDALRAAKTIRVNQFLAGEPGGKPGYHADIMRFRDFEALLNAASRMPDGIALNVVQPDSEETANFAFVVKNGRNMYLCSDKARWRNPFREGLSRRPDRDLERRAEAGRFPYQILFDIPVKTDLPALRESGRRLCSLKDLPSDQAMWIAMLFDLLTARFWAPDYREKSMSALAGHVIPASMLIGGENLPAPLNPELSLPRLTLDEVMSDRQGSDGGAHNDWMSERYGSKIDERLLEVSSKEHSVHLPAIIGYRDTFGSKKSQTDAPIVALGDASRGKDIETGKEISLGNSFELRKPDFSAIGTVEEIDADRRFIARYNYAQVIEREARKEFLARRDEISAWYGKAIQKNIERLAVIGAHNETLWAHFPKIDDSFGTFLEKRMYRGEHYRFMARDLVGSESISPGISTIAKVTKWENGKPHCCVTGAVATYSIIWTPHTSNDLSFLTRSVLPDVLRTWYWKTRHIGNSNLDRIDPMAWACQNPWEDLNFNVQIHLSKRGFAKLLKETPESREPYLTVDEMPAISTVSCYSSAF